MRVLVADDHPLYREAVARQIMRLLPDAAVEEAASMDAALASAQTAQPDLFVFDFYMPGMSAAAIARLAGGHSLARQRASPNPSLSEKEPDRPAPCVRLGSRPPSLSDASYAPTGPLQCEL